MRILKGNKLKGIFQLFRMELPLSAGVCVSVGEILALGKFPGFRPFLLAFLCVFFISSSANILNDYFDYETDQINAPQRPLPSGMVTPRDVIVLFALTSCIGIVAAAWISLLALIVAIILWSVAFSYNRKFKETGLLGNLLVSLCVASMFIFGGVAVGSLLNPIVWSLGGMVFFFDLGEEIASGAMDMQGDQKRNTHSIAILFGKQAALSLSCVSFGISILIGLIPYLKGWLGISYLTLMILVAVLLIYTSVRLLGSRSPIEGRSFLRWNYLGATGFLLVFIILRLIG